MTNAYTSASLISGVTYGVANEILSMSGILNETRQYSLTFQLTRISPTFRAGLVQAAEDYAWSSAVTHLGGADAPHHCDPEIGK